MRTSKLRLTCIVVATCDLLHDVATIFLQSSLTAVLAHTLEFGGKPLFQRLAHYRFGSLVFFVDQLKRLKPHKMYM